MNNNSSQQEKKLCRSCPICDSKMGTILHTQYFEVPDHYPLPKSYDIVNCIYCGFVFADSPANQKDYDYYYGKFSKYEDNCTSTGGGTDELDGKRLFETAGFLKSKIRTKDARILDIGAANGGLLESLYNFGLMNIVGLDPSENCVKNINLTHNFDAYCGSLFEFPDIGTFDVIILSHVLEHIFDLNGAVQQILKLLTQNGLLYIEVPDAEEYKTYLMAPFQDFNTEHINHFSEQSLANLFEPYGLKKEQGGKKAIESVKGVFYPAVYSIFSRTSGGGGVSFKYDEKCVASITEYIQYSLDYLAQINAVLRNAVLKHKKIIIWGAGQLFYKLFYDSELSTTSVKAIVDSNPITHGSSFNGIEIIPPVEVVKYSDPIIITSTIHEQAIRKDIGKLMLKNKIISLPLALRRSSK